MNNKRIFEKIITEKRAKSSNERPKYGLRKLTVGVVSCLLGYMMFFTPNVVAAGKVDQPQAVESTEVAKTENVEEKSEQPKEKAAETTETEQPVSHVQGDFSKETKTNAQDRTVRTTAEKTSETATEGKTEQAKQADSYVPELEAIKVVKGNNVENYRKAFKNLPEDATIKVINEADTNEAGDKKATVEITFADQSTKREIITVKVYETQEDLENSGFGELEFSEPGAKMNRVGASKAEEKLPKNITDKTNWEEKEKKGDDHWELGKSDELKDQRIVRVTTSDPIEINDINYQGYFTDANGRTNLRLVYMEKSAAVSAVWKKAAFNFGDLYDKIDFEESYGVDEKGNRFKFSDTNNDKIKTLDVAGMISTRTQNINNLPINIVLKNGETIDSLGKVNYQVQMRLVDGKGERIYAFAPKKAALDYTTYTRSTSISLGNNIQSEFLRGPESQDRKLAMQRSYLSEFIANPDQYDDTSNLGILRTQYQAERNDINPGNTHDGKPTGFVQMFDANLVKYLKADKEGFIAYTQLLNADRTPAKGARVGIKKENINYTADGKLAYFVIGESNFEKNGVSVIHVDKLSGRINQSGFYFAGIDYVVDKSEFAEEFHTTGQNKVNFNTMAGWIEPNTNGWTVFEEEYDHEFVVPEGDSFTIDLGKEPLGKQIMVQVGDEKYSFVRTEQGYYTDFKTGRKGFDKIEKITEGIYKLTLREGATIKAGDKVRILLPDSADHDANSINFVEITNGSKENKGAATLKYNKDRNIDLHIFSEGQGLGKPDGTYKLIYTPKGSTEQVTINITKNKPKTYWQHDDKNGVLKGTLVATTKTDGNYVIDMSKIETGSSIIIEAYDPSGNKVENLTSKIEFNPIDKSEKKYEKMAWVDHTDDIANIGIGKSLYTPYHNVFTNDYTGDQYKDFYENPRQDPTNADDFMKNTSELLGFTKYDGGKIRMRYIDPNGVIYISKVDAAANEYDDKGNTTKDYTKTITVNGKEYVASPYRLNLKDFYELKEDRNAGVLNPDGSLTLVKDMRLIINASDGSSLPSDWLEVRVKTRVLFDATDGAFDDGTKQSVKVVPDNLKFFGDEGYAPNGFEGATVKANTGDEFVKAPTAEGKTFLGWVTEAGKDELGATTVKSADFNKVDASMKFTAETPITTHQVVYAIYTDEKLVTFEANGGKFDDNSTTKTDDIKDGVNKPADPKLEGKEFVGWAKTADAKESDVIDVTKLTEPTTVYAVWKDASKQTDSIDPTVPAKTPVADKSNLTQTEKDAVKKAIEDANKD
ncbi:MAG: Rib/alpha-like domain-containing protein, partial [Finegoldia magna]|nr:Rib/alpha-like domain-containing protein [Finegoldia magna]